MRDHCSASHLRFQRSRKTTWSRGYYPLTHHNGIDVTEDLVVFRYSHSKTMEYLIKKANRLVQGAIIDKSRTLERELIKDGLMGDGKESLLQC